MGRRRMIDMTDHFHQSNLIEGFDSETADACLVTAWDYLSKWDSLDKDVICLVQKLVTYHQKDLKPEWRGRFRKIPVWIGYQEAMSPDKIDKAMSEWLEYWLTTDPKTAHIQFENIHPFVDGNGRTGRLLMWWQEERLGAEPTLITYEDRQKYYQWFKEK
jgi:hypothetical protein